MNAKTAKKLRKIAMGLLVAAEQQSGTKIKHAAYEGSDTQRVSTNTYKGAYKSLKKGIRGGTITK